MCTSPLPARRVNGAIEFLGRTKERRFANSASATLQIPCGQCIECRLKRSREWAVRCVHEASLYKDNCFVTLTYRDAPVSLDYRDFQLFMKRLRARWPNDRIRFFVGGEYGETNPKTGCVDGGLYRPHFHACLFGFKFPDRVPFSLLGNSSLYRSDALDELWSHGFCSIGDVTFESASYIARYCVGKVTGPAAKNHYTVVLPDGEIVERTPEFARMSLRPGIGKGWFERYSSDVYPADSVVVRGKRMLPPRYYDKQFADFDPAKAVEVLEARSAAGAERWRDHTDDRNNVRAQCVAARVDRFNRS